MALGLKAFRAEVLTRLPLERYPDDHAFASEILMDCVAQGFRVGEIPIPVRYGFESSSVNIRGLFAYAFATASGALRRPPWRRRRYGASALAPLSGDTPSR